MKERVLSFACEGEPLVGILAEPEPLGGTPADVGVLIIVGGPQYRAGSHRQFTLLARHLAAHGVATLRFDYRSMGDSGGEARNFEGVDADIGAAISALLAARPGLRGVVLHGLCDAASAALMYCDAHADARVLGLALQNPWFRSEQGQAQAVLSHYYGRRLRSPEFWLKLLKGGVGLRALQDWRRNRRAARAAPAARRDDFKTRMLRAWRDTTRPVVLQLSGEDLTAREFTLGFDLALPDWQRRPRLVVHRHDQADHTFSDAAAERCMQDELLAWHRQEFKT